MIDTSDVLNRLSTEQILKILEEYGAHVRRVTTDKKTGQKLMWLNTICHGGDSEKLCFFSKDKDFYCYTNCGKMSLFDMVMKLKNCSFSEAFSFLAKKAQLEKNRFEISSGSESFFKEAREEQWEMERFIELKERAQKKEIEISSFYDDNILNYFESGVFYQGWIDEGISIQSMKKFGISWYELEKHIIIPHRNLRGELVGIRRRSLQEKDANNKYMPETIEDITYAHSLGLNLYGLYENQNAIKENKRAIIVEGEKSVLLSDTYFGDESCTVATCGFNISDWQLNALFKLGVEEIYLGFDKDFDERKIETYKKNECMWQEYQRYLNRIRSLSKRIAPYCKAFVLWDRGGLLRIKDSPFDKGKAVLETLIKDKVEITTDYDDEKDVL